MQQPLISNKFGLIANDKELMMFWGKKKDHSATIEKISLDLTNNEQKRGKGVLPFLSIEEAANYAKDKNPLYAPGEVQCHVVIGEGYYNLEFKRHPDRGVYMAAYYYGKASEILSGN